MVCSRSESSYGVNYDGSHCGVSDGTLKDTKMQLGDKIGMPGIIGGGVHRCFGDIECSCLGSKISALSVGRLHTKRGHGRDRKRPARFVS